MQLSKSYSKHAYFFTNTAFQRHIKSILKEKKPNNYRFGTRRSVSKMTAKSGMPWHIMYYGQSIQELLDAWGTYPALR